MKRAALEPRFAACIAWGAQHCQRDYLTLVVAERWNGFETKLLSRP